MANMGYCRFENTANDLRDCVDCWDDDLSHTEARARYQIARMAQRILDMMGVTYDEDEFNSELNELKDAAS